MKFKTLSTKEIKELVENYKGRILTPYEKPEQSKGWVFIVLLSSGQSETGVTAWLFFGVDHMRRNMDGTTTVEWYPAKTYVPCILRNVVGYYLYGWVG